MLSASKQFDELLNSETGIGDDATQGTGPDLFMIGNYDPRVGLVAAKHHMTAGLPTKRESSAFQCGADFSPG